MRVCGAVGGKGSLGAPPPTAISLGKNATPTRVSEGVGGGVGPNLLVGVPIFAIPPSFGERFQQKLAYYARVCSGSFLWRHCLAALRLSMGGVWSAEIERGVERSRPLSPDSCVHSNCAWNSTSALRALQDLEDVIDTTDYQAGAPRERRRRFAGWRDSQQESTLACHKESMLSYVYWPKCPFEKL